MPRIGLISDTHGLVRPEAARFLRGCDLIIHAGDICEPAVLQALEALAPVTAVRGNNDKGAWADSLRETELIAIGDVSGDVSGEVFANVFAYVIHDVSQIDIDPAAAGVRVVVYGHSHKPLIEEREGVLYVNPGSAGPRRFTLPISAGELMIDGSEISIRLVALTGTPGEMESPVIRTWPAAAGHAGQAWPAPAGNEG